jgi:hypothetical protein
MLALAEVVEELLRPIHRGVDLSKELRRGASEKWDDICHFQRLPDHHQINVAFCGFSTGSYRAVNEGESNSFRDREKSLVKDVGNTECFSA